MSQHDKEASQTRKCLADVLRSLALSVAEHAEHDLQRIRNFCARLCAVQIHCWNWWKWTNSLKLVVWLTTLCGLHISERRRRCRVRITNGRIQVLHLLPGLVPDGDVRRVSFIRRRRVCKQLRYRSTRAGPAVRAHDGSFLLTNKPLFHLL